MTELAAVTDAKTVVANAVTNGYIDPVQSVGIEAITILEERIATTEDEITQHIARASEARKRREALKAKLKQVRRVAGLVE